jgi:ferric-dicitrate binding protein FerR (iron transport regulator)
MQEHDEHERRWYLAAKVLSGSSLDPEEQLAWEALQADSQFQLEYVQVKKYWQQLDGLPYGQIDTGQDWQTVWNRIQHQVPADSKSRRLVAPWLRYAAIIAICAGVAFFTGWKLRSPVSGTSAALALTVIEAPPGSKTRITLPDSSTVWLNAKSRLSFDESFGIDNRNLALEGEAFFDVVKSTMPFRVRTPLYDVAVLGTVFNVKAYADDDRVITTLVHGSVRIERKRDAGATEVIMLKPNEKVTAFRTTNSGPAFSGNYRYTVDRGIDAEMETAWKDGWLSVQGESLLELARKLERLYDIKINFEEKTLEHYRYTGRLRQLSLEQVLKALSLTSPVAFTIDEKKVTLREDKSSTSKYRSLQNP